MCAYLGQVGSGLLQGCGQVLVLFHKMRSRALLNLQYMVGTLIKKKKNPHIRRNSEGIGWKVIYEEGLPII
jgi:hypothetical protein